MPRAKGSKNRKTLERETAKRVAAAHAELVKNAPPLDFSMPLDSLDVMEQAMRHHYFRAKIEERLGDGADLRRVDDAYRQAVCVAEKLARYRHAQLSAIKLAGDINARVAEGARRRALRLRRFFLPRTIARRLEVGTIQMFWT